MDYTCLVKVVFSFCFSSSWTLYMLIYHGECHNQGNFHMIHPKPDKNRAYTFSLAPIPYTCKKEFLSFFLFQSIALFPSSETKAVFSVFLLFLQKDKNMQPPQNVFFFFVVHPIPFGLCSCCRKKENFSSFFPPSRLGMFFFKLYATG